MNNRIKEVLENLGYESYNITEANNNLFDFFYVLNINGEKYNVIGIKYFDTYDESVIREQHKKYWNQNIIPVSILIFKDEIRIYNNYNFSIKNSLLFSSKDKYATSYSFTLNDLNNESIKNGNFFEKFNSIYDKNERVDSRLLRNLENTINNIEKNNSNITRSDSFNFITKCILVKYLEDRKIISLNTFKFFNVKNFVELLENGNFKKIADFFCYLKSKFKGDVFSNNTLLFDKNSLEIVASFFRGDEIATGQMTLFPYDFSIIPIELISSIYERFFYISNSSEIKKRQKESGSFYTPYYLVNFIVERELKIDSNNYNNVKVLDPACGSGVFLVAVLKLIVKYYKKNNLNVDGNVLKGIVENQIFGIDKNSQALKIAEFSLTIATLDCLEPKDIEVNKFEFPKLEDTTLFCKSYFEENNCRTKHFDYIIGNPPWYGHDGDHVNYCNKNKFAISDKQIAQAFVYRTLDFLDENARAIFILPNGLFYNENAQKFRKNILEVFSIYEILNLGSIKNELFCGASYPCSIMNFGKSVKDSSTKITNFVPNIFSKIFNRIVFDFTNSFSIRKGMFIDDDRLWNISLNGNYFDYLLLKKMTVATKLKDICNKYSLKISQGYAAGCKNKIYDIYDGWNILNNEISNFHIDEKRLSKQCGSLKCERIHDKNQYNRHNKLIIRRTITKKSNTNICSFYCKEIIYNNKFYCIYDPNDNVNNIDVLYYLEAILNSKYYFYYQFYNSTSTKSSPPEIRKNNLEAFPIVDFDINNENMVNIVRLCKYIHSIYDETSDNSNYLILNTAINNEKINSYKNNIDNYISKIYGFSSIDEDIVNYTLDFAIDISRGKTSLLANDNDVELYCKKMKSLFDKLIENSNYIFRYSYKKYYNSYFAIFSISENNVNLDEFDSIIQSNIFNYEDLFLIKNIYGYSNEYFFTVKTIEKSNWNAFKAYVDYQKFINDAFK